MKPSQKMLCILIALLVSVCIFTGLSSATEAAASADLETSTTVSVDTADNDAALLSDTNDENDLAADEPLPVAESAEEEPTSKFYGTPWALLPPIIAIVLALITKEVYSSLFIGIIAGALLFTNFNVVKTTESIFQVMTDYANLGILIFLVILGIIVSLITKSGGSAAYGNWATKRIKTRPGAFLSTFALGVIIFIDDYFNCLTVGSVMRPVTDKHRISRTKLAYIIDATAAPICIIAPISSWAAAVSSYTAEGEGLSLFIQTIPYNLYALLTIVMVIAISLMNFDFGPMKKYEDKAIETGDLSALDEEISVSDADTSSAKTKGKVLDLVLPVIILIISCVAGMIYTGGFFDGNGTDFITAFSNSDASIGLVLGSFVSLIFTLLLYLPRRVVSFRSCMDSIPQGFKAMVPSIIILMFAWTLGGFCRDYLGAGTFVANWITDTGFSTSMLPAVMFLVALGLAFATGTSWGTFGILIPISLDIFSKAGITGTATVIVISACLAGAVCGDHCSPISDTTIMASAGAQCNHVNHVSTQLPYALLVAAVSFIGYILTALIKQWYILLPLMAVLLIGILFLIKHFVNRKKKTA